MVVKKRCLKIKARTFDLSETISILVFLYNVWTSGQWWLHHEGAVMRVLYSFVSKLVSVFFKSRMMKKDNTPKIVAAVKSNFPTSNISHLFSSPKVVNHILKRCANDWSTTKADATIRHVMKPVGITSLQCGEGLFAKAVRVWNVYIESISIDVFIEGVNSSILNNLRGYLELYVHVYFSDLAFQAQFLLLAIQKRSAMLLMTITSYPAQEPALWPPKANITGTQSTPTLLLRARLPRKRRIGRALTARDART